MVVSAVDVDGVVTVEVVGNEVAAVVGGVLWAVRSLVVDSVGTLVVVAVVVVGDGREPSASRSIMGNGPSSGTSSSRLTRSTDCHAVPSDTAWTIAYVAPPTISNPAKAASTRTGRAAGRLARTRASQSLMRGFYPYPRE